MPIYEYVCEACGRLAEVMQKLSDPAPRACPECGAGPMARMVSRTSFQLKGGGWYADLYASPPAQKREAEAKPAGEASAAPAVASPGGAPAPAPTAKPGTETKPGAGAKAEPPKAPSTPAPAEVARRSAAKRAGARASPARAARPRPSAPKRRRR